VADHLRADLTQIADMARSLDRLRAEFADITRVSDVGADTGDQVLASALADFATGWSDKRNQLIGQLRDLSELAGKAVQEYTGTDTTLAHALTGTGTGAGAGAGAGKSHPGGGG
jgi:endo-1,4-beta-D-glucanase Y